MSGPGGAEDEEGLTGDFVGTVSARLLAAGIPRDERLGALRLLGALDTLADRDDRVRRPLAQVGTEFELPPDHLDEWLGALVEVGAVDVHGDGIVLAGRESTAGSIRLQDFLAVVAQMDAPSAPRRAPAVLRPASAILVAAALLVAVVLTPGAVRNRSTESPATLAGRAANGSSSTAGVPSGTGATPASGGGRVSTVPSNLAAGSLECPSGAPVFDVGEVVAGTDLSTVTGVVHNAADQPVAVTGFTLIADIAGQEVAVPATDVPLIVPAAGAATWQATVPATATPGTTVRVVLDHWEWRGAAAECPAI